MSLIILSHQALNVSSVPDLFIILPTFDFSSDVCVGVRNTRRCCCVCYVYALYDVLPLACTSILPRSTILRIRERSEVIPLDIENINATAVCSRL